MFAWSESYPNPTELESLEWDLGIQNFSDHLMLFLGKSKFHNYYLELTEIRVFSPALDWASYNSSGNLIYKPRGLFVPSFNSPYLSSVFSCLLVHFTTYHMTWDSLSSLHICHTTLLTFPLIARKHLSFRRVTKIPSCKGKWVLVCVSAPCQYLYYNV